jgi:hypothetical protein
MLPALGADRRSGAQWGMFTAADKATTDLHERDDSVLVIRWSKRMRVNDATDRLFVFGDQDVCPILLRVRINAGTNGASWNAASPRTATYAYVHRAPKRHGRLDASHGRGWDPGAFTIGNGSHWRSRTTRWTGRLGRSTRRAGGNVQPCRRAISRSSAIELASTGAMDVEHVAMWPHKLSDVHVDVLVVWRTRRSQDTPRLRDARRVHGIGSRSEPVDRRVGRLP